MTAMSSADVLAPGGASGPPGAPAVASRRLIGWTTFCLAWYAVWAVVYAVGGGFNIDEGFYALASRNVAEGMKPYRDFVFQQMPLLPYVYAVWFHLVGASIESARVLCALFGAVTLCLLMLTCYRRGGIDAAVICGLLVGFNLSYVCDTVSFRTQPLTLLLTAASIFALSAPRPRHTLLQAASAAFFMTLAFLTRLSILPALICLWLYLIFNHRQQPARMLALCVANVTLVLAVLHHFSADGNMVWGVYHLHRTADIEWTVGELLYFLTGWVKNQLPLVICLAGGVLYYGRRLARKSPEEVAKGDFAFLLFLLAAHSSMTLLHCANAVSYPTHQTSNMAFAAVFGSIAASEFALQCKPESRPRLLVGLVVLALVDMPFQVFGPIRLKEDRPLAKINEAAQIIRQNARPGDSMLSLNCELIVNSGMRGLPGYDLSQFGYFPRMPDEQAEKLKVVNFNKLMRDVSQGRGTFFCACSRDLQGMTGGDAEFGTRLKQAIAERYEQIGLVDNYGQYQDTMFLLRLKDAN